MYYRTNEIIPHFDSGNFKNQRNRLLDKHIDISRRGSVWVTIILSRFFLYEAKHPLSIFGCILLKYFSSDSCLVGDLN